MNSLPLRLFLLLVSGWAGTVLARFNHYGDTHYRYAFMSFAEVYDDEISVLTGASSAPPPRTSRRGAGPGGTVARCAHACACIFRDDGLLYVFLSLAEKTRKKNTRPVNVTVVPLHQVQYRWVKLIGSLACTRLVSPSTGTHNGGYMCPIALPSRAANHQQGETPVVFLTQTSPASSAPASPVSSFLCAREG